jgi:uncharacterized protein involved in exopolysaccharide biosynthesis
MTLATHMTEELKPLTSTQKQPDQTWVTNTALLWSKRRFLTRVVVGGFLLSTLVLFLLPNQYESTTRIMPPEQASGGAAMLAALVGRGQAAGGLASLAGGLFGGRSNGALFLDLLRSGTISGRLIDRFQLQHVYRKRYVVDTAKKLARKTSISEDAKSGVITITVEDTERGRARDLAQAYVDELNALVAKVNTSSARRERQFVEQRLQTVGLELQQAQLEMSDFSTKNAAIDIKEQTRAMMDADAKLQGLLVASESELDSLEQIYGNQNARVRAAEARVGVLRRQLARDTDGAPSPDAASGQTVNSTLSYPALRQLPALAVPWANLYRRVRIEETVYEMLSAQYETARIEEAKSIPSVSIVDPAGWPEKKSSPHRLILIPVSTLIALAAGCLFLLVQRSWVGVDDTDTRKVIVREFSAAVASTFARFGRRNR